MSITRERIILSVTFGPELQVRIQATLAETSGNFSVYVE